MSLYYNHHKKRIIIFTFTVIFLLSGNCLNLFSSAVAQTETEGSNERYVSIDFNDVDISVFVKFISELTGKNFVIDNRVKGKVTIISPSKISVNEAYRVFESVLEVYGFATVESGEVVKIISSPEARTKNIETLLKEEARSPDDKIVTQLIPLKYADPGDIKRLFAPLISKSSVLLDYPATDTLIITDVYSNIRRLLKILKTIDVPGVGQTISIIPVEYGDAEKMVKILTTVFQQKKKAKGATDDTSKFVSDDRTNTIIMLANEDETVRIKQLISRLDKEVPRGKGNIHVYYLENAKAEDLAKVLQSLSSKTKASTVKGKKEAPIVSEATNITSDKATNSLIIMAEKDDYQVLEEVIRKLDVRRAMVYIECLIMEVNVDKGFNLGVEWLVGGKTNYDGNTGYFGGGFSGGESGYSNITKMASGTFPSGMSIGVIGKYLTKTVDGVEVPLFPSIGAIVDAYKKDKDVYILSTPQILTTDNEEASITVGKNVPYQTREGTGTTTTTDYSTYNTYEYKDVAIKLTITPQISKDRLIRLKIAQEVSKLDSSSASGDVRPTTLKRTIDTTVVVNDKNTIVLGGLIDDSFSTTEYKIPCVGDIPWLGWLFKSMSRGRERTNLFVFLTPHVIENADEASKFYQEKKDKIDSIGKENEEGIKLYNKNGSDVKIEELKIEDMNE